MQNDNLKKKILIGGGVFIVFIIIFSLYLIFKGGNTVQTTQNNDNKINFPSLSFGNKMLLDNSDSEESDKLGASNELKDVYLVWAGQTIGAASLDDGSVAFVDKASGELRKSSGPNYEDTSLITTLRPNCFSAKISNPGSVVLILCEDGLYLWSNSRLSILNQNAFDYEFIKGSNDFVFFVRSSYGTEIYLSKQNKITKLYTLPLFEITALGADADYIYISEKPAASQNLFVYSFKNKDLYFIGDLNSQGFGLYQKGYVKEKCANLNESSNLCFFNSPESFNSTAWRKGVFSSKDSVYFYSLVDQKYTLNTNLSKVIDAVSVNYNSNGGIVDVIDKNTLNLFVIKSDELLQEHEQ